YLSTVIESYITITIIAFCYMFTAIYMSVKFLSSCLPLVYNATQSHLILSNLVGIIRAFRMFYYFFGYLFFSSVRKTFQLFVSKIVKFEWVALRSAETFELFLGKVLVPKRLPLRACRQLFHLAD